jgi:hypothetical protein
LAAYRSDDLAYVGIGLKHAEACNLKATLDKLE